MSWRPYACGVWWTVDCTVMLIPNCRKPWSDLWLRWATATFVIDTQSHLRHISEQDDATCFNHEHTCSHIWSLKYSTMMFWKGPTFKSIPYVNQASGVWVVMSCVCVARSLGPSIDWPHVRSIVRLSARSTTRSLARSIDWSIDRFWKITFFVFAVFRPFGKICYLVGFDHQEDFRILSFEKCGGMSSQHLKWMFRARVMINFGRFT